MQATILNVDDNALVRGDRRRTLIDAGFNVIDAATGLGALSTAEIHLPDVIVLDVNLPDKHGFEVRKCLRSNPLTMHIPIIHATAHVSEQERLEALDEGAEAVLIEPIAGADLLRAVSKAIDKTAERVPGLLGSATSTFGAKSSIALNLETVIPQNRSRYNGGCKETHMNTSGAAILTNPHPCGHIVYPYKDEAHVAEAVCLFASSGFRNDEAVILVSTEAHCSVIRARLEAEGFDLDTLEQSGQLVCEDADRLLGQFLFDGIIDEHRFKTTLGSMIEKAKDRGNGSNRRVRVFGEMVNLIWTNNPRATQRLEELWNQVIKAHSVPLLCAYSLSGASASLPQPLLDCHSHAFA